MKNTYILAAILGFSSFSISCKDTESSKKTPIDATIDFEAETKKNRAKMLQELNEKGEISNQEENVDKLIESAGEFAESSSGSTAKLARINEALLIKMRDETKVINEKTALIQQAADFSTIKTAEDADQNIAKVNEYLRENQRVKEFFSNGIRPYVLDLLDQQKVTGNDRAEFLRGFDASFGAQKTMLVDIRQLDEVVGNELIKQNQILRDNLDKWTLDEATNSPRFDDEALLSEFNDAAKNINAAAVKQQNAQRKILSQ